MIVCMLGSNVTTRILDPGVGGVTPLVTLNLLFQILYLSEPDQHTYVGGLELLLTFAELSPLFLSSVELVLALIFSILRLLPSTMEIITSFHTNLHKGACLYWHDNCYCRKILSMVNDHPSYL